MKANKFWEYFSWGFVAVNTVCLFVGLELLATGKSNISLFLLILAFVVYINFTIFKTKK